MTLKRTKIVMIFINLSQLMNEVCKVKYAKKRKRRYLPYTYRETAAKVSATTGTGISAKGAWDIMQHIGDRIRQEEEQVVVRMKTGEEKGEKVVPVLFEEMDGVWIRQHHCHLPTQESTLP